MNIWYADGLSWPPWKGQLTLKEITTYRLSTMALIDKCPLLRKKISLLISLKEWWPLSRLNYTLLISNLSEQYFLSINDAHLFIVKIQLNCSHLRLHSFMVTFRIFSSDLSKCTIHYCSVQLSCYVVALQSSLPILLIFCKTVQYLSFCAKFN